jgi:hypothetical protein
MMPHFQTLHPNLKKISLDYGTRSQVFPQRCQPLSRFERAARIM